MHHAFGLFIALCWALFLACIALAAGSAKRTLETDRRWSWGWLVLVPLLALFALGRNRVHLPAWSAAQALPRTPALALASAVLVLGGLILALWGRLALGRNWNLNPSVKEDHELVARGPYAWVRHPMYSGLLLMMLGTVSWHGGAVVCLVWPACFLGAWCKLRQEEKLLTRHFGAAYAAYQARVKALVPFVI
jgi:protein-S-isoprenylcysteine O-methyltransferase Ste14